MWLLRYPYRSRDAEQAHSKCGPLTYGKLTHRKHALTWTALSTQHPYGLITEPNSTTLPHWQFSSAKSDRALVLIKALKASLEMKLLPYCRTFLSKLTRGVSRNMD